MSNINPEHIHNTNNSETNKKTLSLPVIVSTGAMLIASVMSCDGCSALNSMALNTANAIVYTTTPQEDDNQTIANDTTKSQAIATKSNHYASGKSNNNNDSAYFIGANGEMFYNSDAEDDAYYNGSWDLNDFDEDEEDIIW